MKPVMELTVTKIFHFDAAHHLPSYKGKCEQIHGHTYRVEVSVQGEIGEEGMVMDFGDLKTIVNQRAVSRLDHTDLNAIIPQPSAEQIAIWIWNQIEDEIQRYGVRLFEVKVFETPTSFVNFRGV